MVNNPTTGLSSHALITGGSSGIGLALAKRWAAQGYKLTLVARDARRLQAARDEILAITKLSPDRLLSLTADVSRFRAVQKAVQQACEMLGPVTHLVTSAGICKPGLCEDLRLDAFVRTMKVNYFGSLYAVKAVLPIMQQTRSGNIILISSGAGLLGIPGYSAYSPTKFAVRGLAEALRSELRSCNVHICTVYPPDTDTPQLVEERKSRPLVTQRIADAASVWSADAVALSIVRGLARKKSVITPGWEMSLLARWHSVIRPLVERYCDYCVAMAGRSDSP